MSTTKPAIREILFGFRAQPEEGIGENYTSPGMRIGENFGLHSKNPVGSTLLLARKGKPEKLFKALKPIGERL
jgi:hypothetical protein